MHNRVRMLAASFLVKDLHLPWQRGAGLFLDLLVDGDLASNNHGWQWVAGTGTDAAPFHRVFSPDRQAERFDPEGAYVARYVPEHGTPAYPDPDRRPPGRTGRGPGPVAGGHRSGRRRPSSVRPGPGAAPGTGERHERRPAVRRLRARAVLPAPLRLLRLRHLHRPRPPDDGLRGGVRHRGGAGRRARGDAAGVVGVLRRGDPVPAPGRPAGPGPRRRAPPAGGRGHRRVQSRGRDRRAAGHLPAPPGSPGSPSVSSPPSATCWRGWAAATDRPTWSRPPRLVAEAGFASWNLDLIIGGAGERDADWERSLSDLLGLAQPPPHLSAYALTVEPGTPLARTPGPPPGRRRGGRPLRDGRPGPRTRPATGGRRSPTGPGPDTSAGTTTCTGTRGTTGASGRRPTPTGAVTGGGTSAPRTATWTWWGPTGRSWPARSGSTGPAGQFEGLALGLRTSTGVPLDALPDHPDLDGLVDRSSGRAVLTVRGRLLANAVTGYLASA